MRIRDRLNPKNWAKGIASYAKGHFWFPLVVSYAVMVLFIALVLQNYLKQEYLDYLMKEAYRTDQAVLSAEQSSMNVMLPSMIETGSEMATNSMLYYYVNRAQQQGLGDASNEYYLRMELSTLASHSDAIQDIAVVNEEGLQYQYSKNRSSAYLSIWDSQENTDMILSNLYSTIFDKINDTTVRYEVASQPQYSSGSVLNIAFPIIGKQTRIENVNMMLVITFKLDVLNDFLNIQKISSDTFSIGYVTDSEGKIIYHEDKEVVGTDNDTYLEGKEVSVITGAVGDFGWNLNIMVDENAIRRHVDELYNNALAIYVILLVAGLIFLMLMVRRSMRPVGQINAAIKTVRRGELNQKIEIDGENEIWQLAIQYNKMIDSLKEQQQKTYEENQQKVLSMQRANEAEREALESQINAHFLCNTLGAINYNAIEAGQEEISSMLRKLSNILRYTFSKSYENVTVAQELAWVEQYLYLQKFRLMDVFNYSIEFPEEYEEWPCCKLFLQPFVENSIAHGFEGRETGGEIHITGSQDGERLKIILSDNGSGIPEEKLETIQEILKGNNDLDLHGVGIGIRNVVTRLRMFFGDQFSISMETEKDAGTTFTFWLPIPASMLDESDDEI